MGQDPSKMLEEQIFNLKLGAKQLARQSAKCEKDEKAERTKVKTAIEKGKNDLAKIHAENSIRQKNQAVNLLRLSSRMDAIAQRVEASKNMQALGQSMGNVVNVMGLAIEAMDVEKLTTTMDNFEKQFEALDIQSAVMEKSVRSATAMSSPEEDVDLLMRQVADEHNLKIKGDVDDIQVPLNKGKVEVKAPVVEQDEDASLQARLAQLKNK